MRPVKIILALALLIASPGLLAQDNDWVGTAYGAVISSERTWQDVLADPIGADYVSSYLLTGALAKPYAHVWNDALQLEAEGQIVRHFGRQDHWELNAIPVTARWQRFPWNDRVATTIAFGLGLSYATRVPEIEVELESESHKWLIYWMLEATAGPPSGPWAVTLRLHHRSVAWGLMGDEGGMNAVGLGVSYRFSGR